MTPESTITRKTRLEGEITKILEAARDHKPCFGVTTNVVSKHLAQMRLFGLRQGVEFYPKRDTYGFRRLFIENLVESNEVDSKLDGIMDALLIDGRGLFFFRPVGDSYRLYWFNYGSYRCYQDSNGEIKVLELKYSFNAKRAPRSGYAAAAGVPGDEMVTKWVHLKVTRSRLIETISEVEPELGINVLGDGLNRRRTLVNSLGFVPAIECFNITGASGAEPAGDFDALAEQILEHNELVSDISANIGYFGNPTLLSSRRRSDLEEARDGGGSSRRASIKAGFTSTVPDRSIGAAMLGNRANRVLGRMRVAKIIDNLEPNDRVGYITPNAVSGDQLTFVRQLREEIHSSLGGVDDLGISSGATAYEVRSLYGRAAATAMRKCRQLFTYGLCKLLAMIIYHEERIFRESFASAINFLPPEPPDKDSLEFRGRPAVEYDDAVALWEEDNRAYEQELEAKIREAIELQEIPPGVVGLIPDGDTRVEWRHRGPVFEESSKDMLNNTIIVRNLQELGMGSVDALRFLFPEKTAEERASMLTGYPFRMGSEIQKAVGIMMELIGKMATTPHPQSPDLPLLADAKLDLTPGMYRALDSLKRELSHGSGSPGASGSHEPAQLSALERARAARGLPASDGRAPDPDAFRADPIGFGEPGAGPGPAFSAGSERMGDRRIDPTPERDAPIPAAGAELDADPTGNSFPGLEPLSDYFPELGDPSSAAATSADLRAGLPSRWRSAADSAAAADAAAAERAGRPPGGRRRRSGSA